VTAPLVIIGCGGFGREVHDVVDAINADRDQWELLGYLDDAPSQSNLSLIEQRGSTVLGGVEWLEGQHLSIQFVVGVGSGAVRHTIDERVSAAGRSSAALLHPSATVGQGVTIGPGDIICAGARLTNNITLGRHVHVNLNCTIGHDCIIEDYVTLNPLVAVSGAVQIGRETMLGTNSSILQGIAVGSAAIIGAGACVVRDVKSGTTVKGVPAK